MERRCFLKDAAALAGLAVLGWPGGRARGALGDKKYVRPAAHWKKLEDKRVECLLCPRRCVVADQENGWCGVRTNEDGEYFTEVFGRVVSLNNDPIEKKPLFHFMPSSLTLSLSTAGCNFECQFCQNWEISQFRPEQIPARLGFVAPERLVELAHRYGSKSIAFTYGEPVVFYEYMLETAKEAVKAGLAGVMISNGYIEKEPLQQLCRALGAIKVDFKAYSEEFYRKWCRGELKPVLETMKLVRAEGVWLEMVHLTIPTLNDSEEQAKRLCEWVLKNLGPDVPLHFTRFHPTYKLKNLPPTPTSTLEKLHRIARAAGLNFPYVGNLPGHDGENTYCPGCRKLLIRRIGFSVLENALQDGACPGCGKKIPGVWR